MKCIKDVLLVLCFIFTNLTWAGPNGELACPGLNAIKAESLSLAIDEDNGDYLVAHKSTYGTDMRWLFFIWPIEAKDENAALSQGNKLKNTILSEPEIETIGSNNYFRCVYDPIVPMYLGSFAVLDYTGDDYRKIVKKYIH